MYRHGGRRLGVLEEKGCRSKCRLRELQTSDGDAVETGLRAVVFAAWSELGVVLNVRGAAGARRSVAVCVAGVAFHPAVGMARTEASLCATVECPLSALLRTQGASARTQSKMPLGASSRTHAGHCKSYDSSSERRRHWTRPDDSLLSPPETVRSGSRRLASSSVLSVVILGAPPGVEACFELRLARVEAGVRGGRGAVLCKGLA